MQQVGKVKSCQISLLLVKKKMSFTFFITFVEFKIATSGYWLIQKDVQPWKRGKLRRKYLLQHV